MKASAVKHDSKEKQSGPAISTSPVDVRQVPAILSVPGNQSFLQRKSPPPCPCDGGCPHCIMDNNRTGNSPNLTSSISRLQREPSHQPLSSLPQPVTPRLQKQVQIIADGGSPLPDSTRTYFESRFNHDFSGVRIHTGPNAAETAKSFQARAFTLGKDVVFNNSQYSPGTDTGKRLLAHELTHVVQQAGGKNALVRQASPPQIAKTPETDLQRLDSELFWGDPLTLTTLTVGHGADASQCSTQGEDSTKPINAYVYPRNTSADSQYSPFPPTPTPQPPPTPPPHPTPAPQQPGPTPEPEQEQPPSPPEPQQPGPTPEPEQEQPPSPPEPQQPGPPQEPPQPAPTPDEGRSEETPPEESTGPPHPSPRRVTGQPDRSQWRFSRSGLLVPARRALVVAGIHGNEPSSVVLAQELRTRLGRAVDPLARDFDTVVIPRANPGGLDASPRTRKNPCNVDLNRNFPGLQGFPTGTRSAPIQPEVQAIMRVVNILKPDRILSLHAIGGRTKGGAYADPVEGDVARDLACRMALRMVGGRTNVRETDDEHQYFNVRGNRLAAQVCSSRYPDTSQVSVTTAESSFGAWASASTTIGGAGSIPIVTMEVARKGSPLRTTGDGRSVATMIGALEDFLLDNEHLPSEADEMLRNALSDSFLMGIDQQQDRALRQAIIATVLDRFRDMDAYYRAVWLPANRGNYSVTLPTTLTDQRSPGIRPVRPYSHYRSYSSQASIAAGNLGGMSTLFREARTDTEIETAILNHLTTRSLPGFSRHHWGTDIDIVSATATEWQTGQRYEPLIDFLNAHANTFGFFHPYTQNPPDPTQRHYNPEPWHLSYWPLANVIQQQWAARITGTVLDNLIDRTAQAVAGSHVDPTRLAGILRGLNLEQFQTNVSPSP